MKSVTPIKHFASAVAMVRPAAFGYNPETAANNHFQHIPLSHLTLQQSAAAEFEAMVKLLRDNGIEVLILNDEAEPRKPDAVFPNNWFTCNDGHITVFPMCAVSRRAEKSLQFIDQIKFHSGISALTDLSFYEKENKFLEGTGSMVIDHPNRIIYACTSPRTNYELLLQFASTNNYHTVIFEAADEKGREIYHTNVLMCIGDTFAVICSEAINKKDRERVLQTLIEMGHEIIEISFNQMNSFAGNMLQLVNDKREKLLVMSRTAYNSLMPAQILKLEKYCKLLVPDVSEIERAAGGSVRCMMAELFY